MQSDHYSISRLRKNVVVFLLGKSSNAILSFLIFVLVVRLLDTKNYASYVACIAVVEVTIALASFGLDWVGIRYIPEFRVNAPQLQFRRFLVRLLSLQSIVLFLGSVLTFFLSEKIADLLKLSDLSYALQIYSVYLFVEGLGRIIRDQFLGQLLLQGRAQTGLLCRNAALGFGLVALSYSDSQISVQDIAFAEITAAAIGVTLGSIGLLGALFERGNNNSSVNDWSPPTTQALWLLARASFLSYLCSLTYGPQIILFLLSRFSGAEATAAFGFARNLTEQVKRYLPIELFLGLIRPTLIAQYLRSKDVVALNRNAANIVIVSFIVLSPIIVLTATSSSVLSSVLSNKQMAQADTFIVLMMSALIPFGIRRYVETIANTVGRPEACTFANAALIIIPLLTWLSLDAGLPSYSAPLFSLLAECLFCFLGITILKRSGNPISFPWHRFLLIFCAIATACAPLLMLQLAVRYQWASISGLIVLTTAAVASTGIALVLIRPIDVQTIESMKNFVRGQRQ